MTYANYPKVGAKVTHDRYADYGIGTVLDFSTVGETVRVQWESGHVAIHSARYIIDVRPESEPFKKGDTVGHINRRDTGIVTHVSSNGKVWVDWPNGTNMSHAPSFLFKKDPEPVISDERATTIKNVEVRLATKKSNIKYVEDDIQSLTTQLEKNRKDLDRYIVEKADLEAQLELLKEGK